MLKKQPMINGAELLLFITTSMLLAITPGPDVLTVIARGIAQGRKQASVAALGFALGCLNHTLIVMMGAAALLKASPAAFSIIKYLGAAYIIYIGIQMIRHRASTTLPAAKQSSMRKIFQQSMLANLLNPKVALFFLAFLPQFTISNGWPESLQLLALGIIFMFVTSIVFLLIANFAGVLGKYLKQDPKIFSYVQLSAGIFIIALGLGLAFQWL